MIASMFNLDHRLAELRPSEAELRLARQRREAAERGAPEQSGGSGRSAGLRLGGQPSRAAAG
jgi:hypothetical protein